MKRLLLPIVVAALLLAGGGWWFWPSRSNGLVIYSAVGYGDAVAKAFTHQTGIPVTVVELSTGPLLARIAAEGRHPAWSLAWFDGDAAAAALDRAGMLARHVAPDLPWTPIGKSLVPADGSWTPTGVTLAGAVTYRADQSVATPHAWHDLLAPEYRGLVGMNNPAISGPTYPLLVGLLGEGGGWPDGQAFVAGLKANGIHVYATNNDTLAALRAGDIGFAITQSSAAFNMARKDPSLRVQMVKPGFALPSVIAASANLPAADRRRADAFIRFAMSPAVQKLRLAAGSADSLYWPITTDAPAPPAILPPLDDQSVRIDDPQVWGPREPEINAWFSAKVVSK